MMGPHVPEKTIAKLPLRLPPGAENGGHHLTGDRTLEAGRSQIVRKNVHTTEQNRDSAHPTTDHGASTRGSAEPKDPTSLVRRLRAGERTAAEELVDNYYERIYLFMRAVGHDKHTSEDLVQETFLRAWHHIGQLRDGKALNGWLFRIAGNVSRLYWRRHKDIGVLSPDVVERVGREIDGSQEAGQQEQFARLHGAIARLPWKLKQAIVLHYLEQLTIAEAADAAGIRQGTMKSRLNRGLEALRTEIGPGG
jgi:RNA polymerase sigma-70 factor (ECF subfamily)